jgi:hypothetical protein|tara:strand:+ start:382 stop:912 length:531 start_codon:yes stop_codon:yes gene_type:complete
MLVARVLDGYIFKIQGVLGDIMTKSCREKLVCENPNQGTIKQCPDIWSDGGRLKTMLIPEPQKIDSLVREIRQGSVITMSNLRTKLARDAGADMTCPMTTGIFLKIVACAAEEDRELGNDVAPYWRVIKDDGKLNDKFPGEIIHHAELLEFEGHQVQKNRKGIKNHLSGFNEFQFD